MPRHSRVKVRYCPKCHRPLRGTDAVGYITMDGRELVHRTWNHKRVYFRPGPSPCSETRPATFDRADPENRWRIYGK